MHKRAELSGILTNLDTLTNSKTPTKRNAVSDAVRNASMRTSADELKTRSADSTQTTDKQS